MVSGYIVYRLRKMKLSVRKINFSKVIPLENIWDTKYILRYNIRIDRRVNIYY